MYGPSFTLHDLQVANTADKRLARTVVVGLPLTREQKLPLMYVELAVEVDASACEHVWVDAFRAAAKRFITATGLIGIGKLIYRKIDGGQLSVVHEDIEL